MAARKAPAPLPRPLWHQLVNDVTSGLANASDATVMHVALAYYGATVAATPGTKMCMVVEIVDRANLTAIANVERLSALVLDLAYLVDPAFRSLRIEATDATFFADYASAITRAAYLIIRSGACGERASREAPRDALDRVKKKITEARRRAQRKV